MKDSFAKLLASDDDAITEKAVAFYRERFSKRELIARSETSMIGDRVHDIVGATENGIYGFGVLWGYGTRDELENSGARAFFRTPRELVAAFKGKSNLSR